ncbi:MAG TPA: hypothetical protein DCX07_14215 [Phycisphaerales bacterium]|nr:hypothetical protein [Phycisphaerales bacterium]
MTAHRPYRDAIRRLAQAGQAAGIQLVRIVEREQANRYVARPIEFDEQGTTQLVGEQTLVVTNLAEPADADGQVPSDTDAAALDVEGRWVVFLRCPAAAVFPAKVVAPVSGAAYHVLEQEPTGEGTFADKSGAAQVTACNLAELSLGPGGAVDEGEIVLVTAQTDTGQPTTIRYFFDHPAYAKYLD